MAGTIELSGPDLATETIPSDSVGGDVPFVGHLDGKPVVVVRTADGVRAVGGRCTHYGGPLGDGICDGEQLHCPWHHASFDVTTGEAVGAPALNPIPVYRADERDGRITVDGSGRSRHPRTDPAVEPVVRGDRRRRRGGRHRRRDPAPARLRGPGDPDRRRDRRSTGPTCPRTTWPAPPPRTGCGSAATSFYADTTSTSSAADGWSPSTRAARTVELDDGRTPRLRGAAARPRRRADPPPDPGGAPDPLPAEPR